MAEKENAYVYINSGCSCRFDLGSFGRTVTNVFRLLKNCKKIATVCLIFGIISSAFMIPYMDYRVTNDIGTFLHMGLAIADAIVISFMPINVVSILQSNFAKSK